METSRTQVLPPRIGGRTDAADSLERAANAALGRTRPRGLSLSRVSELVADLTGRRFYGKLALHFEAGHIVCAKLEQSIKE
ncbi:MAG: hypothetical protein HY713_12125 [candidate division NC10 bacterium]|nr:hypothetical protein [candidate division NC10 bacterium]